MRFRSLIFPLVFVVIAALIVGFPLRWVAPHLIPDNLRGNAQYIGTIWHGGISGAAIPGTVKFQTKPIQFLKGGMGVVFEGVAPGIYLTGSARPGEAENVFLRGDLARLPIRDGRLKSLDGEIKGQIDRIEFNTVCESASGSMTTDFLQRNFAKLNWRGPILNGPVICQDGDILIALTGADNAQTIKADISISLSGSYRADISVLSSQPEAGVVLPLYGFESNGRNYTLTEQGQW